MFFPDRPLGLEAQHDYSKEKEMPTTLTLFLKGSLVLFAKKDQRFGKVAILRVPPPRHELKISYSTKPPQGGFGLPQDVQDIRDALSIEVTNPAQEHITLRKEHSPIDRHSGSGEQDSVEWFVDLENEHLYGNIMTTIGANKGRFKQILTFESGELFTGFPITYNRLFVQRGSEAEYEEFGYVAGLIGVLFSADNIVFKKGPSQQDVVFDSSTFDPGTEFRIDLVVDALPHSRIVADANQYYKAVGTGIDDETRILFASIVEQDEIQNEVQHQIQLLFDDALRKGDKALSDSLKRILDDGPPAGPEAACFPAYLSRTELP